MAGFRKTGPVGVHGEVHDLNDGTLIRARSPLSGPLGIKKVTAGEGNPAVAGPGSGVTGVAASKLRVRKLTAIFENLQQGSQGPEVRLAQRQLNARMTPSPQLPVDGVFGPGMRQVVAQYQRSIALPGDGILGKQTWFYLLKGDMVQVQPSVVPVVPVNLPVASATPLPAAVITNSAPGVWEWTLEDKFTDVLKRTAPKLPASIRKEFEALLSPASLATIVGTLVVWAGLHAVGWGEAIDIVLLLAGAAFLGMAVFDVAGELGNFLIGTTTAATEKDLEEAAAHLARAIAIIGVAAFIALLAKVAKRTGRGASSAEADAAAAKAAKEAEAAEQAAKAKAAREAEAAQAKAKTETPVEKPISEQSTAKKGIFGEHHADRYMEGNGYKKLNGEPTQLTDGPKGQGIDGVYKNATPPPEYVIGEAKYGTSKLGDTADGKQMSPEWIDQRLDKAVGKRVADQIREAELEPGQVERWLLRVDEQGNVTKTVLKDGQ